MNRIACGAHFEYDRRVSRALTSAILYRVLRAIQYAPTGMSVYILLPLTGPTSRRRFHTMIDEKDEGNGARPIQNDNDWPYKGSVFVTNTEGASAILFVGFPNGRLLRYTMSVNRVRDQPISPITRSFFARNADAGYITNLEADAPLSFTLPTWSFHSSNNLLRLVWLLI
jgi:hypothetical protein